MILITDTDRTRAISPRANSVLISFASQGRMARKIKNRTRVQINTAKHVRLHTSGFVTIRRSACEPELDMWRGDCGRVEEE